MKVITASENGKKFITLKNRVTNTTDKAGLFFGGEFVEKIIGDIVSVDFITAGEGRGATLVKSQFNFTFDTGEILQVPTSYTEREVLNCSDEVATSCGREGFFTLLYRVFLIGTNTDSKTTHTLTLSVKHTGNINTGANGQKLKGYTPNYQLWFDADTCSQILTPSNCMVRVQGAKTRFISLKTIKELFSVGENDLPF